MISQDCSTSLENGDMDLTIDGLGFHTNLCSNILNDISLDSCGILKNMDFMPHAAIDKYSDNNNCLPKLNQIQENNTDFDDVLIRYNFNTQNDLDDDISMSSKCLSKNAINARENRRKKKEYVSELENVIKNLTSENKYLKLSVHTMREEVKDLKNDVTYLKSVLNNDSQLAIVLKNVANIPGMQFIGSSVCGNTSNINDTEQSCDPIGAVSNNRQENIVHIRGNHDANRAGKRKNISDVHDEYSSKLCKKLDTSDVSSRCLTKEDHLYARNIAVKYKEERIDSNSTGGVCVHVAGSCVSLEFCARCNIQSTVNKRRMVTRQTQC